MNEQLLQIPGEFTKLTTMRNNTVRLQFDSQEVQPDIVAQFMGNIDKFGWLCFLAGENSIEIESVADLPPLVKHIEEDKSPAQRLRNTLYVLWQQRGEQGEFDAFYRAQIEKIISRIKEELV